MAGYSKLNGDFFSGSNHRAGQEKNKGHADHLFCNLRKGRNPGFLDAVVITVDAGVEGGKRNRNPHDRKIWGAFRCHQDAAGEKIGVSADQSRQNQGHPHRQNDTTMKDAFAICCARGNELGEGSLDGTGTERKTDAENRVNHMINTKSFCSDGAGQENPVKKAQYPADKARCCQKQGTEQKSLFSRRERRKGIHGSLASGHSCCYSLRGNAENYVCSKKEIIKKV